MTIAELITRLGERRILLWVGDGGRLQFRSPQGALTPELRDELARGKEKLIEALAGESAPVLLHPLSYPQRSLWYIHQLAPDSTAYHVPLAMRLEAAPDADLLRGSIAELIRRHAILRTTYCMIDGVPFQRVHETLGADFERVESTGWGEDEVSRRVHEAFARAFDLERGPIVRVRLFERAGESVLLIALPHIAIDGWSIRRLFDELGMLLGREPLPAAPECEYVDFVKWQRELIEGPEGERLWLHWQERLAGAPLMMNLPFDRPRPPMQTFSGGLVEFELDTAAIERMKALAREERVTPFVVLLAVWQAALWRFCACGDMLIGTPVHGRNRSDFVGVFGDFVNMLVLRTRVDSAMTFRQLLARSRDTVLDAIEHQEFPFSLLVERLRPERDLSSPPIVQVFFSYQNLFANAETAASRFPIAHSVFGIREQDAQTELSLEMIETDGVIRAAIKYNSDLFAPVAIEHLTDLYRNVLAQAAAEPGRPLGTFASWRTHMTTAELLSELQRLDIQIWVEGDRLRVNAPAGAMTDALRSGMAAAKTELIELLSARIADKTREAEPKSVSPAGVWPLSFAQQRLWFMDQLEPGNPAYFVPFSILLKGQLDVAALKQAIATVGARHDALRMVFGENAGEPFQRAIPAGPVEIALDDLEHLPESEREEEARRLIVREAQTPGFDLSRGPLWRVRLIRTAPNRHYLLVTMHHIISDVWSIAVFVKETSLAYEALAAGRSPRLAPITFSYGDYAASQRSRLTGRRLEELLDFWRKRLEGAPLQLDLPTDRPRPAVQRHSGAWLMTKLDREFSDKLRELSRRNGATLFMTLLAAYGVLLSRYSGHKQVLIGTPFAGRQQPETEALVGLFVNTLALKLDMSADPTFVELVRQARESFFAAHDHQEMPFERLVEALAPDRDLSRSPIFQVMFAMQTTGVSVDRISGLEFDPVFVDSGITGARYDLTVSMIDHEEYLQGVFEYDTDLFDRATIQRVIEHYRRLLEAAAENPDARVSELVMMTEGEERELAKFNATDWEHADFERRAHELFEAQADRRPGAIAIECAGETLTYAELNARANALARQLRELGAERDRIVGVCLDRSPAMLVALVAVHKAGAAYLPLDPIYPPERLAYMLDDSGAQLLLTETSLLERIPDRPGVKRIIVSSNSAQSPELTAEPKTQNSGLRTRDLSSDLAYVIYTSGSTGKPKGVAVPQRGLTNFLLSMIREPGLCETDSLLAVTTLCFDIAGLELWGPLCVGGKVVIATREEAGDPERLARILHAGAISVMQATPATWRMLIETGWSGDHKLKALCGGEALSGELARRILDRAGELWNLYGPTETTIWSSVHKVRPEDLDKSNMPLGRPIANTQLYVLDSENRLAPAGIPGELHIGGDGLARGYLNRPELTAERFIEHARLERLYRTGDLARFTAAGELEYLGRLDNQVKLRGFRIELGEIESALGELEGVKQAVVVARDEGGEKRLVAYLVWAPGASPIAADQMRARLTERLPEYMVPAAFTALDALPLTANGKIDRRALPAPEIARPKLSESYARPESATEQTIAAVWQDVLHLDRVGVNDNFFDLGGHSLLLLQVQSHLRRTLTRELSLVEIFQHPTVRSLAARVDGPAGSNMEMQKIHERAARQRAVLGS